MPTTPETVLRVALPVPLPRLFDYLPANGARADAHWIGCRVRVKFGKSEKIGVVAGIGAADPQAGELRCIDERLDSSALLGGELLASLHWTARYSIGGKSAPI